MLRIECSSTSGGDTTRTAESFFVVSCRDRLSRPTVFPRNTSWGLQSLSALGWLCFGSPWLVGMLIVMRVPLPRLLSTEILPWSDSTMLLTKLSPRPVPGLKTSSCVKGVNKWYFRNSSLIPTPVSVTVNDTCGGPPSIASRYPNLTSI